MTIIIIMIIMIIIIIIIKIMIIKIIIIIIIIMIIIIIIIIVIITRYNYYLFQTMNFPSLKATVFIIRSYDIIKQLIRQGLPDTQYLNSRACL